MSIRRLVGCLSCAWLEANALGIAGTAQPSTEGVLILATTITRRAV
jgi:hypothetical protein